MSLHHIPQPSILASSRPVSFSSTTYITEPTTPSLGAATPPNFPSPETSAEPPTPSQPSRFGKEIVSETILDMDHSFDVGEGMGLGYGTFDGRLDDKEGGLGRDEIIEVDFDLLEDPTAGESSSNPPPAAEARGEQEVDVLDEDALDEIRKRVDELESTRTASQDGESSQSTELTEMIRTLLSPHVDQLPFLKSQIDAQRQTILTLQHEARLKEQFNKVERERHVAERVAWKREGRALLRVRDEEIAAGTRPKKALDLDVGYHQVLEAANKRLEMDNRLMAPRLADTQRQIDKLVTELRHLRSHVIMSSAPIVDAEGGGALTTTYPPGPSRQRVPQSPPKGRGGTATMGDARAEHLLLAARKVRSMRLKDDRIGRLTLEELQRHGVVGPEGGVGYTEGYGGMYMEDEIEEEESDSEEEKPIPERRDSNVKGVGATPLLPRARKPSKKSLPPPTTPRTRGARQAPATTPGGSNFNDLLRAAELATRPGTPSPSAAVHVPMSAMSATRSTHRPREESVSDRGSPVKRARREPPATDWIPRRKGDQLERVGFPTRGQDDFNLEEAGLDLLAQASQLDFAQSQSQPESEASNSQLPSATRFEGMMGGERGQSPKGTMEDGGLAPAIDLRSQSIPETPDQELASTEPLSDPIVESALSHIHEIDPALMEMDQEEMGDQIDQEPMEIHTPARPSHHPFPTPGYQETSQSDSPPSGSRGLMSDSNAGTFASPTGGTVPGLSKYVHLTSSMPARRVRSPYLKWTVEEDELLARAVAMHGEKWDLVSKGVPTRSYHQVRQRWLRKTGAFDKKPNVEGAGRMEDDESGSPTPGNGRSISKKRKS